MAETFEEHFGEFIGWRRVEATNLVPQDPEKKELLNEQGRLTEKVVKAHG